MSGETLVIHYFQARARAETARMILAAAGIPFEDKRYTQEEWPTVKPNMPCGKVPVLQVGCKMMPESMAIARYCAREAGLLGGTHLEQLEADSYADMITSIRDIYIPAHFNKENQEEALREFQEKAKTALTCLNKAIQDNKSGWLVGDKMTWADLHLFAVTEWAMTKVKDLCKDYPSIEALRKKVEDDPKISQYLKDRPQAPF